MFDNGKRPSIKPKPTIIALGTSLGIIIGATIGAIKGDLRFWVSMGICCGAAFGSTIYRLMST
tara:strand:- start:575 stop:763 length:189 start_codon:yes stop_codon:yes gene_type:complete